MPTEPAGSASGPLLLRQLVLAGLRITGLVLLAVAAFSLPAMLQFGLSVPQWLSHYSWSFVITHEHLPAASIGLIAGPVGAAIVIFSGRLALWIVPNLRATCLRCGHRLTAANGGVCPECGAEA